MNQPPSEAVSLKEPVRPHRLGNTVRLKGCDELFRLFFSHLFSLQAKLVIPLLGEIHTAVEIPYRFLDTPRGRPSAKKVMGMAGGLTGSLMSFEDIAMLLGRQPYGPDGPQGDLLTGEMANFFFIPQRVNRDDVGGLSFLCARGSYREPFPQNGYLLRMQGEYFVIRIVSVQWVLGGWYLGAGRMDSLPFGKGRRVFYRTAPSTNIIEIIENRGTPPKLLT